MSCSTLSASSTSTRGRTGTTSSQSTLTTSSLERRRTLRRDLTAPATSLRRDRWIARTRPMMYFHSCTMGHKWDRFCWNFWTRNPKFCLPGLLQEWGRRPYLPPWPPWPDLAWTWTPRPPLCDRSGGYLCICVLENNHFLIFSRWNWRWPTIVRWVTRLVQNLIRPMYYP